MSAAWALPRSFGEGTSSAGFLGGSAGRSMYSRLAGWSLEEASKARRVAQDTTKKDGSINKTERNIKDTKEALDAKKKKMQVLLKRPLRNLAKKEKPKKDPNRLEIGGLPAVNYNIDTGFGVGVILNLARFAPGYYPYRWRLFLQIYTTLRPDPAGGVENPYHSHFLELDMPGLIDGVRLRARVEFRRFSTAGYYGLGNNSEKIEPWANLDSEKDPEGYRAARRYQQYDRIYPFASLGARITLWQRDKERLELFLTGAFTYNFLNPYPGSRLEKDIQESKTDSKAGQALRQQLLGIAPHALLEVGAGLLWDTRDNEFTPQRGILHEISFRGSPGVDANLYYAAFNATLRFYQSIYKEYLVIAFRILGDVMLGNVPFYLLAEHGGFFSGNTLGAGGGLRAVPTGRYHGKIKMLGNLELRSKFLTFNIGSVPFSLGVLAFFDFGRAWLDFNSSANLFDGISDEKNLFGMKFSGGGGLRIQWGESLVVRLDVGYSNIGELGFYLDIAHIF
ncbi:MAG: BamA/TamA family outer membrane protein [Myxococcales bacterium]|nr:BamA/TamA family outer membrane protein [Myxococcales bacterium]